MIERKNMNLIRLRSALLAGAMIGAALGSSTAIAQSADIPAEDRFFVNNVSDDDPTILSGDLGTGDVQKAINRASNEEGGGVVRIMPGEYTLGELKLKANVRLEIHKDSIIVPSGKLLFGLGSDSPEKLENIEVTAWDDDGDLAEHDRYTVKVDQPERLGKKARVFHVGHVENFSISNARILDNQTTLSSIVLSVGVDDKESAEGDVEMLSRIPRNGVIKNFYAQDTHYGYGLVQAQGGQNIYFENMSATGGVTLRLETGAARPQYVIDGMDVGALHNIYGYGISVKDGHAAVLTGPHAKMNGFVHIERLIGVDSTKVASVSAGFVSAKAHKNRFETEPGRFSEVIFRDITAISTGAQTAQAKRKNFNRFDEQFLEGFEWEELEPARQSREDGVIRLFYPLVPVDVRSLEAPYVQGEPYVGRYPVLVEGLKVHGVWGMGADVAYAKPGTFNK